MKASTALALIATLVFAPCAASQEDKPAAPAEDAIKVTVLDEGKAPRKKLRYKFRKGYMEAMQLEMTNSIAMNVAGQAMPAQVTPPIIQTIGMKVDDLVDGVAQVSFELSSIELGKEPQANPVAVAAMQAAMKQMVGLKGSVKMDARGFNKGSTTELPEDVDPALEAQFKQIEGSLARMSAPLPDEAVGVGGKWKVVQPFETNGAVFTSTATYEVLAIDGDVVKTQVVSTIEGGNQNVDAPGLPPGAQMVIDKMTGKGEGTTSINLTGLNPTSDMKVVLNQQASLRMQGQVQKMIMDMEMKMKMAPKLEAPE